MRRWNFDDRDSNAVWYYVAFIVFTIAIAYVLTGCATTSKKPLIKCIDGKHTYSIIPKTRYELIEENGCVSGEIELRE